MSRKVWARASDGLNATRPWADTPKDAEKHKDKKIPKKAPITMINGIAYKRAQGYRCVCGAPLLKPLKKTNAKVKLYCKACD